MGRKRAAITRLKANANRTRTNGKRALFWNSKWPVLDSQLVKPAADITSREGEFVVTAPFESAEGLVKPRAGRSGHSAVLWFAIDKQTPQPADSVDSLSTQSE